MLPKKSNIQQNKNQSKKKVRFDMDKNQLHKLFFVENSPTAAYNGSKTSKNYSEVLTNAADAHPNSSDSFRLRTTPQRFNMRSEDFPDLSHSLKIAADKENPLLLDKPILSIDIEEKESSSNEMPEINKPGKKEMCLTSVKTFDKPILSVDTKEQESSSNEIPEQAKPAKRFLDDQFGLFALASMIRNTDLDEAMPKTKSSNAKMPSTLDKPISSDATKEKESSSNEMPEQAKPAKKVLDDQFGLLALASMITNTDPDQTMLCKGLDLTRMGLDLNCPGNLLDTFRGALDDIYGVDDTPIYLPKEYKLSGDVKNKLKPLKFKNLLLHTLFYIFYTNPLDQYQLLAAKELYERQWRFHKVLKLWARRSLDVRRYCIENTMFTGEYDFFSPDTFKIYTQITTIDESQFAKKYC
ncbi:CCR4-NOT transcription complex subunit 2-like [Teleopsis dalmanni]|uniref:CCR4-NOT transcription complex subunit 2-like n=1 Tax=Teleopsis dalmanni TaxID=139649 RepID=UPI0018CFE5F4|nr:CCR4-NOT transcription complex subunit 2-like [Teleopsis dalmanni]